VHADTQPFDREQWPDPAAAASAARHTTDGGEQC
jgi:hypothetical protein